ncbi:MULTISPECIES: DNA polymerase [unclassified Crossiella]|uniref:DNA polymerase n=1 Tax=unclassified Crossiella TaxID=2620835 RepID=UPI001FFF11DC|nr:MULTISPECIES: DNA polymerase [unclassified Crossiella]MCK2240659.1 DNA polymerase [Crossiella sp. S99.2]MCK2252890.1 DNA polymerase [Crossiella sp. S99.1]
MVDLDAPARPVRTLSWPELLDQLRANTPTAGAPQALGLDVSGLAEAGQIRVVPMDRASPVLVADVTDIDPRELDALDSSRRIRWVAADLMATAATLARAGVRLRRGYCVTSARRLVDGYHRTDSGQLNGGDLSEDYRQAQLDLRATTHASALDRLVDIDSANALAAVDLNADGIPWDAARHHEVLAALLGEPTESGCYPRLSELDEQITAAFGGARFRWRTEVPEAFDGAGLQVQGSRVSDFEHLAHPAVPPLTSWRHLDLLANRFGYEWAARWTHDERWWPVFHPAATSTGRWTAEGGGLALPHALRRCVRVQPGRRLVIADISQLEPRILAYLAGDRTLLGLAERGDLYAELGDRLGVDRAMAKTILLAALNGRRSVKAREALRPFTSACSATMDLLAEYEQRARHGATVRTELGRTMPLPDVPTVAAIETASVRRTAEQRSLVARAGRRGRSFPVQGTAAEVCCATLAILRTQLRDRDARLAAFLHDEFVLDVAEDAVEEVTLLLRQAVHLGAAWVLGLDALSLPLTVRTGSDWGVREP